MTNYNLKFKKDMKTKLSPIKLDVKDICKNVNNNWIVLSLQNIFNLFKNPVLFGHIQNLTPRLPFSVLVVLAFFKFLVYTPRILTFLPKLMHAICPSLLVYATIVSNQHAQH